MLSVDQETLGAETRPYSLQPFARDVLSRKAPSLNSLGGELCCLVSGLRETWPTGCAERQLMRQRWLASRRAERAGPVPHEHSTIRNISAIVLSS